MRRPVASATRLENLRKEAKRWLKCLRAGDAQALKRLRVAYPDASPQPVLRDVQHALAREYGHENWKQLKLALERSGGALPVERFLEYACPDHHVRGIPAHRMASHAAMRLLHEVPSIAHAELSTAVVCGEIAAAERILHQRPELARVKRAVEASDRAGAGSQYDFLGDMGAKDWEPLLFLAFTRLPLDRANDNAVEMARLLLRHGADPNAFFMAGDSRYTPLTGVVGEGEEARPPHPRRDELVRVLLEHGAEPYDSQVIYNLHFHGKVLWCVKLMHEFSIKAGRAADWQDPEWHMLDQGGYGSGARWHLRIAVEHDDLELAEWCLAHGANPNAAPGRDPRLPQRSLYEHALWLGHDAMAELFVRHGARRSDARLDAERRYVLACLQLDRGEMTRHPEFLHSTAAIFAAARKNRVDVVEALLDLGTPVEIEDGSKQRTLHVAAASNAVDVARLLLRRGAEVDPVEKNWGNTPLGAAVYHGRVEMIDLLAQYSRDIWELVFVGAVERVREVIAEDPARAQVSGATTPLFWLPEDERDAMDIGRILIQHGADASWKRESDDATAAEVARKRGMQRLARFLERAAEYQSLARDWVNSYEGDDAALQRLNEHYGRAFTHTDLRAEIWRRNYVFRQRSSRVPKNYLTLQEGLLLLVQDEGFNSWATWLEYVATGSPKPASAFEHDAKENRVAPLRRMSSTEAENMVAWIRDHGVAVVRAGGWMTDELLERVSHLEHVTHLSLGGSSQLSDDGLLHLARMPQLQSLELNEYPGGKLTDRGLEVLRHLPNLRSFEMMWQAGITDAGVANLRYCEQIERVSLMGSPTGDGAIEALQGKPRLFHFRTGRLATDRGLSLLHNYPRLKNADGGGELLIDGPFSDEGLASLAGLEGVVELDLFWHVKNTTSAGIAHLARMPNLQQLGCDGELSDDAAMVHIAAIPRLRKLRVQESVATDGGFVALSRSQSIEEIWGRVCANFGSRGFLAFAQMPRLRSLAIGLANVDDDALAELPRFPALRELTPVGMQDSGFAHVGRCTELEKLTCMYCRDITDVATEHIAGLALKYYYAGLTRITDRSLEVLGRMHSLEQVDLYQCQGVTDAGLVCLAALPQLREVNLDGLPGVTQAGIRVFPAHVRVGYSM